MAKDTEQPVMFVSKTFNRSEVNYTVTEKECLAVVWATEELRQYLLGKPFVLETDHSALKYLLTDKEAVGRIARWQLKVQEYDMKVKYRKGEDNIPADYVSRIVENPDGTLEVRHIIAEDPVLSTPPEQDHRATALIVLTVADTDVHSGHQQAHKQLTLEEIRTAQQADPWIQQVQQFMTNGTLPEDPTLIQKHDDFLEPDDVIYRFTNLPTRRGLLPRKPLALLVPTPLQKLVLQQTHDHLIYGHRGIASTYNILQSSYYWPTMRKDCKDYVSSCSVCQRKDGKIHRVPNQIRENPEAAFSTIALDFAGPWHVGKHKTTRSDRFKEGTTASKQGHRVSKSVLVIVDYTTRYTILVPVKEQTTKEVIDALIRHVYVPYGPPSEIIMDEGRAYTSQEMNDHCAEWGIYPNYISPEKKVTRRSPT